MAKFIITQPRARVTQIETDRALYLITHFSQGLEVDSLEHGAIEYKSFRSGLRSVREAEAAIRLHEEETPNTAKLDVEYHLDKAADLAERVQEAISNRLAMVDIASIGRVEVRDAKEVRALLQAAGDLLGLCIDDEDRLD